MRRELEFWTEYSDGPLWSTDGAPVEPSSLGLSPDLTRRLRYWNAGYDDAKLPFERNDRQWIAEGAALLTGVRSALGSEYEVVVTEPWWGEDPSA